MRTRSAASPGGEPGAPRRQHGRERLAEQGGDLRQGEHAVAGGVVDAGQVVAGGVLEHAVEVVLVDELVARVEAEDATARPAGRAAPCGSSQVGPERVGEAQHGHRDAGWRVAKASTARSASTTLLLQRGARRMRALHLLVRRPGRRARSRSSGRTT
jgi:hypothetical protein